MNDFFSTFVNIEWLVSVVFVGLLLNIISHFLEKKLDDQLSNISTKWKTRSDKQKAKREEEIETIVNDPEEKSFYILRQNIKRQQSLIFLMFSIGFLVITNVIKINEYFSSIFEAIIILVLSVLCALAVLLGLFESTEANRLRIIIYEAHNRKQKNKKSGATKKDD